MLFSFQKEDSKDSMSTLDELSLDNDFSTVKYLHALDEKMDTRFSSIIFYFLNSSPSRWQHPVK